MRQRDRRSDVRRQLGCWHSSMEIENIICSSFREISNVRLKRSSFAHGTDVDLSKLVENTPPCLRERGVDFPPASRNPLFTFSLSPAWNLHHRLISRQINLSSGLDASVCTQREDISFGRIYIPLFEILSIPRERWNIYLFTATITDKGKYRTDLLIYLSRKRESRW